MAILPQINSKLRKPLQPKYRHSFAMKNVQFTTNVEGETYEVTFTNNKLNAYPIKVNGETFDVWQLNQPEVEAIIANFNRSKA